MSTIFITGAKGFIGRNLALSLTKRGDKVVGLGHGAISKEQLPHYGLADWINGDVDHTNLQSLARRHGMPNSIYHMAGGSNVGRSIENPLEDFNRTVVTAGNLFEWVRLECPAAKSTIVSSAAVYGQGHLGPIAESVPLRPYSPYGAHKAMMEQLARSYAENYGLLISACRLFSVYGAGLEKQLIYDLCVKFSAAVARGDRHLDLFGTGDEIRDWVHVVDVCHLLPMVNEQANQQFPIFNGGSGRGVSVRSISEMVGQAFGISMEFRFNGQQRAGDPTSLISNVDQISELGFCPRVKIEEGIESVVSTYLEKGSLISPLVAISK